MFSALKILSEYINDPDEQLISYNKKNSIAVFSGPITSMNYGYNTGLNFAGDEVLMHVDITDNLNIAALELVCFEADNIICSMTDNSYLDNDVNQLSESAIHNYSYSDYGKLGLAADGNSQLILRIQIRKSGTLSFSVNYSRLCLRRASCRNNPYSANKRLGES